MCRPRSDAVEEGVCSQSTLFALSTGISIKHGKNKNTQPRLLLENGPFQNVKVVESIRHKWVNVGALLSPRFSDGDIVDASVHPSICSSVRHDISS